MSQAQAARLVLAAIAATLFLDGYTIAKKRPSGADVFRSLWSLGVLYVILSFMADTVPEIAGAFSVLLIVACIAAREQTIAEITNLISGNAPVTNAFGPSGLPPGVHGPVTSPPVYGPPGPSWVPPGVTGPVG